MTEHDPRMNDVGTIGWISVQELRNLDTEMMREFDKAVWPVGSWPSRDHVMKFFETWKYRLMKRSRENWQLFLPDYQRRMEAQERAQKKATEEPDGRQSYETRLSAMRGRVG